MKKMKCAGPSFKESVLIPKVNFEELMKNKKRRKGSKTKSTPGGSKTKSTPKRQQLITKFMRPEKKGRMTAKQRISTIDDRVLDEISPTEKHLGVGILRKLRHKAPHLIEWNRSGQVQLEGKLMPNSNLSKIINYMLEGKGVPPEGFGKTYRVMRRVFDTDELEGMIHEDAVKKGKKWDKKLKRENKKKQAKVVKELREESEARRKSLAKQEELREKEERQTARKRRDELQAIAEERRSELQSKKTRRRAILVPQVETSEEEEDSDSSEISSLDGGEAAEDSSEISSLDGGQGAADDVEEGDAMRRLFGEDTPIIKFTAKRTAASPPNSAIPRKRKKEDQGLLRQLIADEEKDLVVKKRRLAKLQGERPATRSRVSLKAVTRPLEDIGLGAVTPRPLEDKIAHEKRIKLWDI